MITLDLRFLYILTMVVSRVTAFSFPVEVVPSSNGLDNLLGHPGNTSSIR